MTIIAVTPILKTIVKGALFEVIALSGSR